MKELNVLLVGAQGSGKSSFALRFVHDKFIDNYDAEIEERYQKTFEYVSEDSPSTSKIYLINLLDTANVASSQTTHFLKNLHTVIYCFSVTNAQTFQQISTVQKELSEVRKVIKPETESLAIIELIVGTKCDAVETRQVTQEEGKAEALKLLNDEKLYLEVSALNNINVSQVFQELIKFHEKANSSNSDGSSQQKPEEKEWFSSLMEPCSIL
eukprot:TRINITY_DN760_c0_g1_i3.p1 TRINITY_DN760_c0_g1~~TRINITY_DN760_c0_g1_i3.p1  ORF type:complete len:212 (-),score=59.50 TRINITY_DN760_c0_g1_i3:439-1074(-)